MDQVIVHEVDCRTGSLAMHHLTCPDNGMPWRLPVRKRLAGVRENGQ